MLGVEDQISLLKQVNTASEKNKEKERHRERKKEGKKEKTKKRKKEDTKCCRAQFRSLSIRQVERDQREVDRLEIDRLKADWREREIKIGRQMLQTFILLSCLRRSQLQLIHERYLSLHPHSCIRTRERSRHTLLQLYACLLHVLSSVCFSLYAAVASQDRRGVYVHRVSLYTGRTTLSS